MHSRIYKDDDRCIAVQLLQFKVTLSSRDTIFVHQSENATWSSIFENGSPVLIRPRESSRYVAVTEQMLQYKRKSYQIKTNAKLTFEFKIPVRLASNGENRHYK